MFNLSPIKETKVPFVGIRPLGKAPGPYAPHPLSVATSSSFTLGGNRDGPERRMMAEYCNYDFAKSQLMSVDN